MSSKSKSVPVYMIDKESGKVIRTFSSMKEASQITGISRTVISYVCTGLGKTAGGYIWRKNFDYDKL